MTSLLEQIADVAPVAARVTDAEITVELSDGRFIIVPTAWYPRLTYATSKERRNYELYDDGIAWPDVEADTSVRGLLLGRKSGENPECLQFWLRNRRKGKRVTVMDWLATRSTKKTTRKRK